MMPERPTILRWTTTGSIALGWSLLTAFTLGCETSSRRSDLEMREKPGPPTRLVVEVETANEAWSGEELYIAVFQDPDRFLDRDAWVAGKTVPVTPPLTTVVFEDVPSGPTAISGFIDLVPDSNLTRNFIGLPEEPWGFSNDISILLVKPDFEEAAVMLDPPEHHVRFAMGRSLDRSDVRRRRAEAKEDR